MNFSCGSTKCPLVCLLKLIASSNVKASAMRVAVHAIYTVVLLNLKQN